MQNLVFQELGENFVKSNTLTNFFAFGIPFIIFPAIYVKSFHEIFATQDTSEMTIEIDPLPSRKIETFYEILTKLVSRKIAEFSIFYMYSVWHLVLQILREIFRSTFLWNCWMDLTKVNFQWKLEMCSTLFKVFNFLSSTQAEKFTAKYNPY